MTGRARWGYALVLAVVAAGWTYDFGGYPLLDPDEGRNAEVAREMAATNGYVLPRLNGLPYLDKPVLHFAATAAVFEVTGPSDRAARLPSLAFTLATLVLVGWFGRRLTDGVGGLTAAVATATTPFALAYARTVIFDATLTFWIVAALVCFHEAVERGRDGTPVDLWRAGAWGAMALGVLTKGPVALLVPALVAVPYAWWRGRLRALVDPASVLLLPALVIPWVAAVSRTVPDFAGYVLFTETAARLAGDSLGRAEPFWYFLAILPAAALPWCVVLAAHAPRMRGRATPAAPATVFLLLWIAVPLVFFSLASGKRPQYVLPLIPAVGLLVAHLWHPAHDRHRGARAAALLLAAAGVGLLVARSRIASLVPATDAVAAAIPPTATGLGIACVAGALLAWVGTRARPLVLLGLAFPVTAIPLVSAGLMQAIGADRSAAAMAGAIADASPPGVDVVAVHAFPLSLPFYLDRTLTLVTDDAAELTSNYLVRRPDTWAAAPTIRPSSWWRDAVIACDRPRVFVTRTDDTARTRFLETHLRTLAVARKYVAYGPCGPPTLAVRP